MKKIILLLAFSLCIFVPCPTRAEVTVALTLDRQEGTPSDSIRMVVQVSGARSCDTPPVIEGLDLFQVSQGGSSSRVEIINGKFSSGVDYTYFIQASKPGTFQIGPAKVKVNGKLFQSNTRTLTILKTASPASPARGPIFLTASLSSEKVFVEEQVLYTLKLYLSAQVSDISLQLPERDRLVFKQLEKPREYQGVYEGSEYRVIEVRYALMALQEGDYGIQPARMDMTAYESRGKSRKGFFNDPFFADPFFRAGRPVSISSKPLELKVMPLPLKGKPDGFSGLVGSFRIEAELAPSKIRVGESATLTVRVSGRGNINRIPDLKMPGLDHMKVYADEPVFEAHPDHKGLAGSKTMKWAIVPEQEGDFEIPPLSFSFFDPGKGQYSVLQSPKKSLVVLPGKGKMIMVEAGPDRQKGANGSVKRGVKEIGHDILPLHTSVRDMETRSWVRPRGPLLWLILLLPFFLYLSTFLGLRLKKRSVRTLPAQRAKKAAKKLIKECREKGVDADHLTLCIRDYFNDRFGLALAALTPDDAAGILTSRGVSSDLSRKLRTLLIGLENTIYTGKGQGVGRMGEEIPRLVREIEREIL
ncbi:MAG: BatD family protein [Pseudomonadota bacterium]